MIEENQNIQCKMCDGLSCIECSKLPESVIQFMMSGVCPWICRHCNRTGLPTLKNINDHVTKQSRQLNDLKVSTDQQHINITRKIELLEKGIDVKIENKFKAEKEKMSKEIEQAISSTLDDKVDEAVKKKITDKDNPDLVDLENRITAKVLKKVDELIDEKLRTKTEPNDRVLEEKIERILDTKMKNLPKPQLDEDDKTTEMIERLIDGKLAGKRAEGGNVEAVSPRTYMKNTVINVAGEMKEKEKRMQNMIVFGLEMSKSEDIRQRNKEDQTSLIKFVKDNLGVTIKEDDIKENQRLIKADPDQERQIPPDRPPPLKVVFKNIEMKDVIFKNLHKLRGRPQVTFSHDYTSLEREANKILLEKAKERSKKEGVTYRVRGPPWNRQIVRIETKETVVEQTPLLMTQN